MSEEELRRGLSRWTISPHMELAVDPLTMTAANLCSILSDKHTSITSVDVVQLYHTHILKHNESGARCRAMISIRDIKDLVEEAKVLDVERQAGRVRSPLHGIPIILKDVFATAPELGMPTTAGSWALAGTIPGQSAPIVETMRESGLIIMGKTNMTELSGNKGTSGWSAVGGMCQPAYIPSGYKIGDYRKGETTPAGSSTGSAVGVACGFAPLSLGAETSGSLVTPAVQAALYCLKLTHNSVPLEGVFSLTAAFDTYGPMAKSPIDVAMTADVLQQRDWRNSLASAAMFAKAEGFAVAFLDIELWRLPEDDQPRDPALRWQTAELYQEAKQMLRGAGVRVEEAFMTSYEDYVVDKWNIDELLDEVIDAQTKNAIDRYLDWVGDPEIRTLEDIIAYNAEHPEKEFDKHYCPDEAFLETLAKKVKPDDSMSEWLAHCKNWSATQGIDKIIAEKKVDVVVCFSDSFYISVSIASGYPMCTVPLGYIHGSGRPVALEAIAPAGGEHSLVEFMTIWERINPERRVPDLDACERARMHPAVGVGTESELE